MASTKRGSEQDAVGKPLDDERWVSLLAAARGGCSSSLGEILDACRRYLLVVARQSVSVELQAKAGPSDLVQETLFEAGKHFRAFHGESERELLAWLRGILQNRADTLNRYFHTAKRHVRQESPIDGNGSDAAQIDLADSGASPSSCAAIREEAETLEAALARLSPEHSLAIRLRNQQGLSFVEIGRQMERSTDAARKLWARAVERLQSELERAHAGK